MQCDLVHSVCVWLQVCGSHGVLQANNPVDTAVTRVTAAGVTTDPLQYSFPQRYARAYAAEVNHLVDCILGKDFTFPILHVTILHVTRHADS